MKHNGAAPTGDKVLDTIFTHRKTIVWFMATLLGISTIYATYSYYKNQLNRRGFVAMTKLLEEKKNASGNFEDFFARFDQYLTEAQGSNLAPFLSLEKANVLAGKGEYEQALQLFNKAINDLPSGLIKDLYLIKKFQVKAAIPESREAALQELEALSMKSDFDSAAKSMALYFLHTMHWNDKNIEKALAFGQNFLKTSQPTEKDFSVSKLTEEVTFNVNLLTT